LTGCQREHPCHLQSNLETGSILLATKFSISGFKSCLIDIVRSFAALEGSCGVLYLPASDICWTWPWNNPCELVTCCIPHIPCNCRLMEKDFPTMSMPKPYCKVLICKCRRIRLAQSSILPIAEHQGHRGELFVGIRKSRRSSFGGAWVDSENKSMFRNRRVPLRYGVWSNIDRPTHFSHPI
jgi:hypothetical protein